MELKTYFAQDAAGNIISSAIVNVFLQGTTTLATGLTRADGTPLENPFAADGAGRIQFRAPDGYYDVQVSAGPGIIQTLTVQCVDYSEAKEAADMAQTAADKAEAIADTEKTFPDAPSGIAGTTSGEYFRTPRGPSNAASFNYWKNESGTAVSVAITPGVGAIINTVREFIDLPSATTDAAAGNIPAGSYCYARNASDTALSDEYLYSAGVLTATGRSVASYAALRRANILFDAFNEFSSSNLMFGGWNWYKGYKPTFSSSDENLPLPTPVIQETGVFSVDKYYDIKRLPLRVGDKITVSVIAWFQQAAGKFHLSWFDSAGALISTTSKINLAAGVVVPTITDTVPTGAVSFRIRVENTVDGAFKIGAYAAAIGTIPPEFIRAAPDKSQTQSVVNSLTASLYSRIDDMQYAISEGIAQTVDIQVGKFIEPKTGATHDNPTTECAFIDHHEGDGWLVTARVTGTALCLAVYYNAAGAVIGTEYDGTSEVVDLTDYEITVPAGTTKIGITSRTAVPIAVKKLAYIKSADLKTSVQNLDSRVDKIEDSLSYAFNAQDITTQVGKYINRTSGAVVDNAAFECAFVDHTAGDRWKVTARVNGTSVSLAVYYNAAGAVIGTEYDGTSEVVDLTDYEITVPAGTTKIGITSRTVVPIVIKKREIVTDQEITDRVTALEKPWYGKTIDQLGDSNIQMWRWQPLAIQNLGCQMLNHGVGGSKIAKPDSSPTQISMCDDARINALSPTADAYTVLGGTNDWAQSIPLGTIADTVDTTFYGAYKIVIQKILTLYPGKQLFLMTPFYTEYTGPRNSSWEDGLTNAQGLKVADYAEAVRQLGKRYGLPVIDHYHINGWNEFNAKTYLVEENSSTTGVYAHIHLNTDIGAKRMADRFSDVVIGLRNFNYS